MLESIFFPKEKYVNKEFGTPTHIFPMQSGTPIESPKMTPSPQSSCSKHLRFGSVGSNYVILEGMQEAKIKARWKACKNSTEARKQCLDMDIVLYKMPTTCNRQQISSGALKA